MVVLEHYCLYIQLPLGHRLWLPPMSVMEKMRFFIGDFFQQVMHYPFEILDIIRHDHMLMTRPRA